MNVIMTVVERTVVVVVVTMEDGTWIEMMMGDDRGGVLAVNETRTMSGIAVEAANVAISTVSMTIERGMLGTADQEERDPSEMVILLRVLLVLRLGLPMAAQVLGMMTTLAPAKIPPHLATPTMVSRGPGLLHRHYHMTTDPRCQKLPKIVTLGASKRICIGGMVDLMEEETISNGMSHRGLVFPNTHSVFQSTATACQEYFQYLATIPSSSRSGIVCIFHRSSRFSLLIKSS
jgi:hypothetical protein